MTKSQTKTFINPAKRLINASTKCPTEATLYGECILQNYKDITKDRCLKEFKAFKHCVEGNFGRKI